MKRLLVVLVVIGGLLVLGWNALSKMTVDVNPASIARSMTQEQRAEACDALSGGTEGGYELCMDGMALAELGIQNQVIPDLSQQAEWSQYLPGYNMTIRNQYVQSFSKSGQAGFGACFFDMLASTLPYSEFLNQQLAIQNGADPSSFSSIRVAISDCENGTFFSFGSREDFPAAGGDEEEDTTSTDVAGTPPSSSETTPTEPNQLPQSLASRMEQDRRAVEGIADFWVPILSQKWIGLEVDGLIFDESMILELDTKLRAKYGALLLWSGDYTSFPRFDIWANIIPERFSTKDAALDWCRASDRGRADCGAKIVSKTKPSKGSSGWLP